MMLLTSSQTRRPSGTASRLGKPSRPSLALGVALMLATGALLAADSAPPTDSVATSDGPLVIRPINHASLALLWKQKTILVDPVGSVRIYSGLAKADLVIITHQHYDHFNKETLAGLSGSATLFVAPPTVVAQMPADLRSRTTTLTNGQTRQALGVKMEAIPAYNTTAARLNFHPKGRDNGYVLTLGGQRLYVSGDTEDIPEMRSLQTIDVAFVCMNLP